MRNGYVACSLLVAVFLSSCEPAAQEQLEANKDLVHRFAAAIDAHDWGSLDALVTSDIRRHSRASGQLSEITSLDEFKQFEQTLHTSFSDGHVTYEIMIAEGNMVAAYATFTGVNTGPLGEVEATGKSVQVKFMAMFRIETAKVAEIWVEWDNVSRLAQLGLFPPPGANGID
jgi:predicted ester cyclase